MTRVCLLPALGAISYPDVDPNDPHAMHNLLRGYMEPFPLPHPLASLGLMALADEEGLLKDLAPNMYSVLLGRSIVGPVIIARSEPPEFVDLTDDDVAAIDSLFGQVIIVCFDA
jgi:hypothetical protein